jgi:hypothetical protein
LLGTKLLRLFHGELRCGFGRNGRHRNDGHSQRRFGGRVNDCPVASRHAHTGFGWRVQPLSISVGEGGEVLEARSSGGVGTRIQNKW